MRRWSVDPPPTCKGITERHFFYVPDGYLWEHHPKLGTPAARAGMRASCAALNKGMDGAVVRLALQLSYDGVDMCNPLGFARGISNMAIFSYAIINLDA